MPIRKNIPINTGLIFISFGCYRDIKLIEIVNGYDIVYAWFDILKLNGHQIIGYVIMPSLVHVTVDFRKAKQRINTIVGNGKRFMAYEIIDRLNDGKKTELLELLGSTVSPRRRLRGKKHNVWKLSFAWNICRSKRSVRRALNHCHYSPRNPKWKLCRRVIDYNHSSAMYYRTGIQGIYEVTDFRAG